MANETTAGAQPAKKSTPAAGAAQKTPAAPAAAPAASAAAVDPAAAAIRDAAREAEIRRLTEQRDELRERLGDEPTLAILRAEVDALQQAVARSGAGGPQRWTMSAGVAADLETVGYATDPSTGDAFVRDGDRVKVTSRSGATRTVDMPPPSGAGQAPAEKKS